MPRIPGLAGRPRWLVPAVVGATLVVGLGATALAGGLPGGGGAGTEASGGAADARNDMAAETTTTEAPTTTEPPTTTTTAPTTTVPPTTTTTAPPPPPEADGVLELGENGEAVLALQNRLTELGYWLGKPDGNYGQLTRQAVMAFQKVEGLGRDGVAGPATQERLAAAGRPKAQAGNGIEIDLQRQVLFLVEGGQVRWAVNASTGNGEAYASPTGRDAVAVTPTGQFRVERQIDGTREAPLGTLYRPKYFIGGIAVHGSGSVPAFPASHGCVRVTNSAMDMIWSSGIAAIGAPVLVH